MDPMKNPEEHDETRFGHEGMQAGQEGFHRAWEKTQEGIRSMKQQAGQSLESVRQRLSQNARSTLVEQKDKSVSGLRRISSAIHEAAARLDEEGDHTLAGYTDTLGTQIEKAANYLENRDPSTVLRDVEGFARRQAGLFIGGMLVTGLIVGRLIQSARESRGEGGTTFTPEQAPEGHETAGPQSSTPSAPQPGAVPPSSRFGGQGLGPLEE